MNAAGFNRYGIIAMLPHCQYGQIHLLLDQFLSDAKF